MIGCIGFESKRSTVNPSNKHIHFKNELIYIKKIRVILPPNSLLKTIHLSFFKKKCLFLHTLYLNFLLTSPVGLCPVKQFFTNFQSPVFHHSPNKRKPKKKYPFFSPHPKLLSKLTMNVLARSVRAAAKPFAMGKA